MAKDKNLDKDINLEAYNDSNGVSLRDMNLGLWLAENRQKLLKILTIFLIALCAFFFIFSAYNYIIYFISGDPNQQLITDNSVLSPRKITADLEISSLQIFPAGETYDLAVKLKNPNEKFLGTFNYCFSRPDKDIFCGSAFILPAEEKYILALNQTISGSQSALSFNVSNVFWQRLDAHKISDWNIFSTNRLNFLVNNLSFTASSDSALFDKIKLNTLEFSIKNQTAYSYYETPLNILLFNGPDLVGVNRHLIPNFLAGEEQAVKLNWAGNLNNVNRTVIAPDINIMDDTVYFKYGN